MSIRRPATRRSNQKQYPAPFAAYILKSHSTQNSKLINQQQSDIHICKQLNQYLRVLKRNQQLFINSLKIQSTQFRKTANTLKNNKIVENNDKQRDKQSIDTQTISPQLAISIPPMVDRERIRQRQNHIKISSLSPVKKNKITDNKKIISSLRYQIISLYQLFGKRQQYMNSLKGKHDSMALQLTSNQIQERLQKYEETKGRDKGRVKFNYLTNQQLRSLKYKSKTITVMSNTSNLGNKKQDKQVIHYDDDEQGQDLQNEQKEEKMDYQTWRRRNNVGYNQRVFIIKGGYYELRKTLIEKGWFENEDVWSPYYDFKWTTRICDINFMTVKHTQGLNHFNNNHHLTSKYGITRRLKTLNLGSGIDSDKFYPKCFDLGDQVDFQNFVENFKFSFSQSVAKRFLIDKTRYKGLQLKIRITYQILKRRSLSFKDMIQSINKSKFITITPEQWQIITETTQKPEDERAKKLTQLRKLQKNELGDIQNPQSQDYEAILYQKIDQKVKKLLVDLKQKDPQFDINGMRNVWIVKPNFMSRGRGIRCFNNLYDIADYCLGLPTQFVVQKYIQNPLIIQGRKFDIRQWVLIQNFNPPRTWFYQQCYLRFTNDEYNLQNIYNRFAHLTNNSIQKYSKKHNAQKSMWQLKQLKQYLGEQKWTIIQQKIKNIIVWSVKSCQGYVIGKKGSVQLVGYDFMIDENLNPWLIEVNMSPSMDYSTPVTKRLVPKVLQDTGRLINSSKKNKQYGQFTCIYNGNQDLPNFNLYNI